MNNRNSFRITEQDRQSTGSLAVILMGAMICVPFFLVGAMLAEGLPLSGVIISVLLGAGMIFVYACFIGLQSCDEGLPTVYMAAPALGTAGARYVLGLLVAVAAVVWFGIQTEACGAAFSAITLSITGASLSPRGGAIVFGLIMTLTGMNGYPAQKYLSYVVIPFLFAILFFVYIAMAKDGGIAAVLAYTPDKPMSLTKGINLAVGAFAVEGIFIGDYARFGKGRKNVLVALVIGCIPTGFLILFFGAAGSIVLGQPNIIMILVRYGFPAIGLISLALSAWTTNVMNAYSGGYGLSCLLGLGANRFAASTGIVGLAGTVLGALGIMGWFSAFLNFLAISFPPMAGVIIASYWIRGERSAKKLNVPGIIAYAVSVAAALVTSTAVPFLIGPLNGIVCAVILYCLLAKLAGHGRAKDV